MALSVNTAHAQVNGTMAPITAEEDELYDRILRLREVVLAGHHPVFKLSQSAIENLKLGANLQADSDGLTELSRNGDFVKPATDVKTTNSHPAQPLASSLPGLSAFPPYATPSTQPWHGGTAPASDSKPIGTSVPSVVEVGQNGARPPAQAARVAGQTPARVSGFSSGLDPIFLEKSDSLVRAEGQLKRQRIEKDLQAQVEHSRHAARDRDNIDTVPAFDINDVLARAYVVERHISGLKPPPEAQSPASSFDENDYYSSQVESEWSSPASAVNSSDRVAGSSALRLRDTTTHHDPIVPMQPNSQLPPVARNQQLPSYSQGDDAEFGGISDDEDEYIPPDINILDEGEVDSMGLDRTHVSSADDASEYEPGEIIPETTAMPSYNSHDKTRASPQVPIIRNHLTHIVAPQPSRVSPLAVAKGPNFELELVDGRPELVKKNNTSQPQNSGLSRQSSASPSANGLTGNNKKRRKQKRKRERESEINNGRGKKKNRKSGAGSPPSPNHQEPAIKDEPRSPSPLVNVPVLRDGAVQSRAGPHHVDLVSPQPVQRVLYAGEDAHNTNRFEYAAASPLVIPKSGTPGYRVVQRDTRDLRRIASLHNAQLPASPSHQLYTPAAALTAQHRSASAVYGEHAVLQQPSTPVDPRPSRYEGHHGPEEVRYVRAERLRSPLRLKEYRPEMEAMYRNRAESPAMMPPPQVPVAPKRIVVDQHGNRYIAAEPALHSSSARASVVPFEHHRQVAEDRFFHHQTLDYQEPPVYYSSSDPRIAPHYRRQTIDERPTKYISTGANGALREYSVLPTDQQHVRYVEAPAPPSSVVYEPAMFQYERMAPPPAPTPLPAPRTRDDISPPYASRSYSVHPDNDARAGTAILQPAYPPRQASVAPLQYIRQHAPSVAPQAAGPHRPVSVAPSATFGQQQARAYAYAPVQQSAASSAQPRLNQQFRYVDHHGHEILPNERTLRHASEFRY